MDKLIEEYDNTVRCYSSRFLRQQLSKLRREQCPGVGAEIHDEPWALWRRNAGLTVGIGKQERRTKVRSLTKREAAIITLQALWNPAGRSGVNLKRLLGSRFTTSTMDSLESMKLFNQWVEINGCAEASDILEIIYKTPTEITGSDLEQWTEKILGERIPVRRISRVVGTAITRRGTVKPRDAMKFFQIEINKRTDSA